jgi:predicted transcriptional regulator
VILKRRKIMTVNDIKEILEAEIICRDDLLQKEVNSACGSDMMSDVLAFVKEQAVLLTGLVNPQVVRTAEMMDMHCIVFVRGKRPTLDMIEMAEDRDMVMLCTELEMFTSCGRLYENGLRGGSGK